MPCTCVIGRCQHLVSGLRTLTRGIHTQAARTEDAIATYHARLTIVRLLLGAPAGALGWDVDTLAALLRRLFRTVHPDTTSPAARQRMRAVLEAQVISLNP